MCIVTDFLVKAFIFGFVPFTWKDINKDYPCKMLLLQWNWFLWSFPPFFASYNSYCYENRTGSCCWMQLMLPKWFGVVCKASRECWTQTPHQFLATQVVQYNHTISDPTWLRLLQHLQLLPLWNCFDLKPVQLITEQNKLISLIKPFL